MMDPSKRVCDVYAEPLEDNIYEWHFTIRGPSNPALAFKDGIYHGALIFPNDYPFSPPDIIFYTPNGRFDLHRKICSTISSYHPERWRPAFDVGLILIALRLFMAQELEPGNGTVTHVPHEDKVRMATESWAFRCNGCGQCVQKIWDEHMKMYPETSMERTAMVPEAPPTEPPATAETTAAASETTLESDSTNDQVTTHTSPGSVARQQEPLSIPSVQTITASAQSVPCTLSEETTTLRASAVCSEIPTSPSEDALVPKAAAETVDETAEAVVRDAAAVISALPTPTQEQQSSAPQEPPGDTRSFEIAIGSHIFEVPFMLIDNTIMVCFLIISVILLRRCISYAVSMVFS